jgi:hypothetical protein
MGIVTAKLPDAAWGEPTIARVIPTEDGGDEGPMRSLLTALLRPRA